MSADESPFADPLADKVRRCLEGSRIAQKELYDACHGEVYGLTTRMVGRQDAADVAQQVFMQVFRKLNQFNGQSRFKTWLYRLAVNESLQHLRKNKRKQQVLSQEPIDDQPQPGQQQEAKDILEQALERIEPLLRSVFLLKEVEGLSYREIAEATDIPEGTVGSRLNRARQQLRGHLVELGWENRT